MRWRFLIFALLICNMSSARVIQKSKQTIVEKNKKLFITYNNHEYEANNIVTVKFVDIVTLQRKYPVRNYNKLFYADIEVPSSISLESFIAVLEKDPNVLDINLNGYGEYTGVLLPDDTYFSEQWHIIDTRVDSAWTITTGSPTIKVAILDAGVDWLHPDLGIGGDGYQNIYCNSAEDDWTDPNNPNSGNQIDDDGNGFIDDYKGWNFATNSNDSRPLTSYHGTVVAGIISAKTNNGIGVSGIAGGNNSNGVRITSYNIGDEEPETSIIDDAIITAVDNGCHIIQLSFAILQSNAIDRALDYAKAHNVNVVSVSGKSGDSILTYPGSYPSVIAVGALEQGSRRSDISNYGEGLDIVAPGSAIWSTTFNDRNKAYWGYRGTSFASPQVAATIALMLSINPTLTCDEVRYIITSTAQKLRYYSFDIYPKYPNGEWNNEVGYGLLNAYAAVLAAKKKYIQNHTYQSGSMIVENYPEIIAGYAVTDNNPYGNVILEVGSDVTFNATEQVLLKSGFHAKAGSKLHVMLDESSVSRACAPQRVAPNTFSDETYSTNNVEPNNSVVNAESEVIISTSIYTISGQLIQTILGGQHEASHLPNGMYILQHRMSDGSVRSEKIANNK